MKKLRYIIAFSLLVLGGSGAELRAQTPPNPPATSWYPPPSVQPPTLAVTNASARVALPAAPTVYPVVTVVNVGAQEIFCRLGDATVTVTTASYEFAIPGNNGYRAVWDASSAYVACITASSTSTARITQSNGGPTLGFNGAPASLPPSGAAGGDLAGTYPNPTVANLSNVTNASLANSGLANSSLTIAGHAVSLGDTQAIACADLSNGATGCSTATGTSGATIPLLNGANTWSGTQTINGASFGLTGNITGAAIFGTNGIRYKNVAGTLSDTTSSGTVATNYDSKFGGNTLTATNATTITNNFGSYFTAPVCSTNVTCTANWALGADSFTIPSSGANGITLCNTADCATNYERLREFWTGNVATINTEAGGTGVLRGLSLNSTTFRPSASTSGRIDFAGGGSSVSSIDARWASTLTASSGTQTVLAVQEVINQSGSAGYTALLLNPTESGTGSGSKFLLEGKIGAGADVFTVDNTGLGRLNGVGVNGAPVASSLISVYNATPAERVELGINGSAVGLGLGSGGMTLWGPNAVPGSYDTGLSRDSVLGAGNLDLGNGTANDKSGTLNLLHIALSSYATTQAIRDTTASQAIDLTTSNYVDILGAHPNLRTAGALVAGGSAPTPTGTCTHSTQTGGNTAGTIVLTCTAQTLILTFTTTAPTGWMCEAIDQTTTADTMKQTANSTTTCTLTGTTAASDVILFQARAY